MGGTIIVSLGDSKSGSSKVASNPALGDILSLVSAAMYVVYITLIRKKLPDDDGKSGHASMAQFLGYLGLFNILIFLPIPLVLNFANLEPFNTLTWKQLGLIVGKDKYGTLLFWRNKKESEENILLDDDAETSKLVVADGCEQIIDQNVDMGLDAKGRWTRSRVAKVSLFICPFWFLAQLTFNLSLKYTTVTSNTILSSSSSLFTFLVSLVFLGEVFTWVKLFSVLLCMGGAMYAVYITLIRKKLPDDDGKNGHASMAQCLWIFGFIQHARILAHTSCTQLC